MIQPQVITFNKLRGINTKKAITNKSPNEAEIALNGYFDVTGSFVTRNGFRRINTTEIGSNFDIDSAYQFGSELILAGGAILKAYDVDLASSTDLSTTLTGSFFDFEQFIPYKINYLIGTNGQDFPFKYDGTTYSLLSIATPTSSPTAANGIGGSLTGGAYFVAVTFIRDNGLGEVQESNPCTQVSVVVTNNRIVLTNVPISTDPQVTGRRIYCTRPVGSILFRQGVIANNVSTSYNIDTLVTVAGGTLLEYDHDPAPKAYMIESYKGYLILAGNPDFTDRVYISKYQNVWYFPQGELDINSATFFSIGERIMSIKSYYDLVFIFGENGNVFYLTGGLGSPFQLSQIKNDQRVTALCDRATLVQENFCYFLNTDGYWRTNGQVFQKVSEPLSSYFDTENQQYATYNVYGFPTGFNQVTPCATYFKQLNQILLFMPQSNQNYYVNNVCFAMHLSDIVLDGEVITPNYSIYTNFSTRCTASYYVNNTYKYLLTSQSDGFLYEAEKGDFDGASINSTATSATATTLIDSTQAWTVNTYTQLWVTIRSGTGAGQSRVIISNTATELTVDHAWDVTPDSSSTFSIGGINYQYAHSWNSYGSDTFSKRLIYLRPRFVAQGDVTVDLAFGYGFTDLVNNPLDLTTLNISGGSLWDDALWDVALWDGPTVYDTRQPAARSRIHRWNTIVISNQLAGDKIQYDGLDKIFQVKGIR
ncbi:MAG: hypothetical protein QG556_474 [Pseudomonadota bacterium]|nr:hypothetical protein [Pseudomonadota bacterium]